MPAFKIGFCYDDIYLEHNTGMWHPESSQRLKAVLLAVEEIEEEINIVNVSPRAAQKDDLLLIHNENYIDEILEMNPKDIVMLDPDTFFSKKSKEASLKAVGAVLSAVDQLEIGKINRVFCAVRPPGHHATSNKPKGFCIFNNLAVGVAYALKEYSYKRIAIIDWDAHHGNGMQDAFYYTNQVFYVSLHQYPFYPGTGSEKEIGLEDGVGYTLNIPFKAGAGDNDYRNAFENKILPALEKYSPELIFISAGFDSHENDHLANINLSSEFFGEMTSMIVKIANKYSNNKIISVLEGGYNPEALRESVIFHLRELAK